MPTVKVEPLPMSQDDREYNPITLNGWANHIQGWGIAKGWSDELLTVDGFALKALVIEKLLMMHTELSEATEDVRAISFTNGKRALERLSASYLDVDRPIGFASELIDTIIRVLHLCAILGIDVEHEMRRKMTYNWTRPARHGGKSL